MRTPVKRFPRGGHTIKEAAELTGLSEATISAWTSEPRGVYLARADEKRVQILRLRAQGMTMRAIAAKVGCSVGLVAYYCKGN